jgi:hypothetical protein
MLNLKDFYYQVVYRTPPSDRYFAIQEQQDVLVVNFDCLYDRECSIRGMDQLLYLLHQKGQGKRFLFISEDGANIRLSGAIEVIKNVINCFGLTADTCAVVCRESLEIPNCTVITNDSIPYWCKVLYTYLRDIPISQATFDKKFAVWYNRGPVHRLELAKFMFENYRDSSYISYQEAGMIVDQNLTQFFQTELAWAKENTPIVHDQLFPNRRFNFNLIVGADRKQYNSYFLEVVAETDILSTDWITEKTIKNLYIGKPFIVMGAVGTLRKLHNFGFKTFSPWIDESYDLIENIHLRLETIKREIDRLASKTPAELQEMHQQLLPTFIYNRKAYHDCLNYK